MEVFDLLIYSQQICLAKSECQGEITSVSNVLYASNARCVRTDTPYPMTPLEYLVLILAACSTK